MQLSLFILPVLAAVPAALAQCNSRQSSSLLLALFICQGLTLVSTRPEGCPALARGSSGTNSLGLGMTSTFVREDGRRVCRSVHFLSAPATSHAQLAIVTGTAAAPSEATQPSSAST